MSAFVTDYTLVLLQPMAGNQMLFLVASLHESGSHSQGSFRRGLVLQMFSLPVCSKSKLEVIFTRNQPTVRRKACGSRRELAERMHHFYKI